ncbi:replication-relaxation family protein [Streptomyces sp. NPDC020681]|uniref:replication-relaxation family protein n=1 Tax=Streptomyces sp. NPDC020681 TaxID=3365083 RepID=UPI00379BB92E
MSGKSVRYPYGSTAALRGEVLRVLGVLKVATPDQIQRLTRPHLSYRYGESERDRRNKAHRNAALDLAKHGQTVSEGNTRAGLKLWGLTPLGLEAAARELDRPLEEMGSVARGTGTHGAAHAMAVNDTIAAFIQPRPTPDELTELPEGGRVAAEGLPRGMGTLDGWSTELGLAVSGTWSKPGRGSAQADAVLVAPEHGVPLLFVEVDCGHMTPEKISEKFAKYERFFHRTVKDTDGTEKPMWCTRWAASGREGFPPIALVFTGRGPNSLQQRMRAVKDLSIAHWAGGRTHNDAYVDYDGRIPIVVTTLERLQMNGPYGQTWWRYSRGTWQPLNTALDNPDGFHVYRDRLRAVREAQRRQEERAAAEREKHRPVCTRCEERFTDGRWRQIEDTAQRERHPELCADCAWQQVDIARFEAQAQQRAAMATCEECGGPLRGTDPEGENRYLWHDDDEGVPPPDGIHCPACRFGLSKPKTRIGRILRRRG